VRNPAPILIIDDDPIIRMLANNALREAGHAVTEADSAEAAIALVDELRPELILLDLVMPGMGGLAFCGGCAPARAAAACRCW